MDELRSEIWDYLFRTGGPRLMSEIATQVHSDPTSVRAAVTHEWFAVQGEQVAIAYRNPPQSSLN